MPKPDDFTTTTAIVNDGDDDDQCKEENDEGVQEEREDLGGVVQLIPGMLMSYDTSTRLFGIRYTHGNR